MVDNSVFFQLESVFAAAKLAAAERAPRKDGRASGLESEKIRIVENGRTRREIML